jgi:hypothetical protein
VSTNKLAAHHFVPTMLTPTARSPMHAVSTIVRGRACALQATDVRAVVRVRARACARGRALAGVC